MNVILRVVDTETTGLDPAVDKIVEIACVDVVLGADGRPRRGASWSTLVNPGMVRSVLVSTVQPLAKGTSTHGPAGPLSKELGVHVVPSSLRLFLRYHWKEAARLAHKIHEAGMRWEKIAPFISLTLNLWSMGGYAYAHDWHKAAYWFGAAIITASLTFGTIVSVLRYSAGRVPHLPPRPGGVAG